MYGGTHLVSQDSQRPARSDWTTTETELQKVKKIKIKK